ncbi:hypothetical protein A9R05_41885 (plasmid) [Burkholderia sp. KK1]|uniref:Uncharacterized protein n=1 Tax=Burkholderia sp. M701 TaxID=326454 RepID=V5YPH6_9BURK|nr:hypothetical protein [Burkholderia sp. M701]AQH05577.1 hypothetical protein A9R05_41885 [Burkholderia sp. KK1]BAO18841.1 hypothetical protein [Burkholderia sp. M701]
MNEMKKLTLAFNKIRLGIALVMLAVLATKLHSIDSGLQSAKISRGHDVAAALAVAADDYASRFYSAVADDQPVDVPIGQTLVTTRGEKLTCTRDRVMIYSRA